MIDLHSHILPGIDDGAPDISVSLEMARRWSADGVTHVACTPHILPGVYANTGPAIIAAVADLQARVLDAGIPLTLISGADNHVTPDFVSGLRSGHLLPLGHSRYVLVEPPHHVAPARLEDLFFEIMVAGYHPILTHPERLSWIEQKSGVIDNLVSRGVWMQITSGSLTGRFGRRVKYWAERLLCEGKAHIVASDAHNLDSRPPDLARGRDAAEQLVGGFEAQQLVSGRPLAVLSDLDWHSVSSPSPELCVASRGSDVHRSGNTAHARAGLAGRLRSLVGL